LIGAMALVIVVAVVLPWVLESEPRKSESEIAVQIPSLESGPPFSPRIAPPQEKNAPNAAAADAPAADTAAPNAPAADALGAEQARVLAAPEKAAAKEKTAAAEPKKKPGKAEPADARQFVVQIAALADADKARSIQQELAAKGLKAYTEKVKTGAGEVTRVRVGPFPNRDAADKERARLQSLGFEGSVAPR
jgi:DedD protein